MTPAAQAQSSNQLLVNFGVGLAEIDRSDISGYSVGFGYRHVADNNLIVETEALSFTGDPLNLGAGYRIGLPAAGVRYLAFADSGPSVSLGFLAGLSYTDAPGYNNVQADVRLSLVGDLARDPTKFHPNLELLAIVPFWTSEPNLVYEFGDLPGTVIARIGLVFPRKAGGDASPEKPDPSTGDEVVDPTPVVPPSTEDAPLAIPEDPPAPAEPEPIEPQPLDLVGGPDGVCEQRHPEPGDERLRCQRAELVKLRDRGPAMAARAVSPEVAAVLPANPLNSYWWYVPRPKKSGIAAIDAIAREVARLHATVTLVDYALYLSNVGRQAEAAALSAPLDAALEAQLQGSEELERAITELPAQAAEAFRRDPLGALNAVPVANEIIERYRLIVLRVDSAAQRLGELAAREYVEAQREAAAAASAAPAPGE